MHTRGENWDVTESIGTTALVVAAMRAAESRRPDALYVDPFAELLVAHAGPGSWGGALDGLDCDLGSTSDGISWALNAVVTARTCYFDHYLTTAVANGVRQVAILACGLDARAYRLPWPAETVIFELDQPKVLEFKAAALAGEEPAADRRAVPADLRHDWPNALRQAGFDAHAPTAWLAEGLLRYLSAEAQSALYTSVTNMSAVGAAIALNMGRDLAPQSPKTRAMRARILSELGAVGVGDLAYPPEERSDPREWFGMRNWTVSETDPITVLTKYGRTIPPTARAELARHVLITASR